MEVIISMVISAIIMSLTFVIFTIITERMLEYKKQNQNTHDLNRFTYSINKDIFDSDKLEAQEDKIQFSSYSGEVSKYYIEEHNIIRYKNEFIDTFKIEVKNIQLDSLKSKSGKINFQKIKMKISTDSILMDLNFYKPIFANELLSKKFKDEP